MDVQPFCGKGPQLLLCVGWKTAYGEITISGAPDYINNCVIFIVCTQFTNAAVGRIIQPGKWAAVWRPLIEHNMQSCSDISHTHNL
jgi:hypothetical protein